MVKPMDLMITATERILVILTDPKRRGHTMHGGTQGILGLGGQSRGRRRGGTIGKKPSV